MLDPLWQPSEKQIASTRMASFMNKVNERYNKSFSTYDALYRWSITDIEDFWELIFEDAEPVYSQSYNRVLDKRIMPGAKWFDGCMLNFARNLLKHRNNDIAIISHKEGRSPVRLTYNELYCQVAACAAGLKSSGVSVGDRVAGFLPNTEHAVIAMLATTSIGAIWSSCSPDFGSRGALDRFGQIEPKVLFTADGYRYSGKAIDSLVRVREIVDKIPSIEKIVIIPFLSNTPELVGTKEIAWDDYCDKNCSDIAFVDLPFDQPVYILYSSGTTGVPKCIVHSAGGTLLQHHKEHALHTNIDQDDILFYFTTCGWMMWNWLVGALTQGASIVLYQGSPSFPNIGHLWKIAEQEKITVFGTSPKFLSACQKGDISPRTTYDLSDLRTVLSTGAPLLDEHFKYVYSEVKSDLQLSSISGGTDIVSCFMLGNPLLPVYSGEIQCRGLGMKVEAYNDNGKAVDDEVGELVCSEPFPSMPVTFWDDRDGSKYRAAYFQHFDSVWRHGDFIRITDRGSVIVYGRSDATLNPGGVRIGTAEIYEPVESIDEVEDSIVVGQQWRNDTRIILFVVLKDDHTLDNELKNRISNSIRRHATARHVPAKIIQVSAIPHTINGKKVEVAVTRAIHGKDISNMDSLANPESLSQFMDVSELRS